MLLQSREMTKQDIYLRELWMGIHEDIVKSIEKGNERRVDCMRPLSMPLPQKTRLMDLVGPSCSEDDE